MTQTLSFLNVLLLMNIKAISVGPLEANCYILWNKSKNSIVIDPGAEANLILKFLKNQQLDVSVYLVTHAHIDHISALAELSRKRPAPIGMHSADLKWAFDPIKKLSFYPAPERPEKITRILADTQEWDDGNLSYKIIGTPGHSPGSVCFYFQEEHILFSGDTLFQGSVGRTDLPASDPRLLNASLKKLRALPTDTRIYPGHGPETTLKIELQINPFLINL